MNPAALDAALARVPKAVRVRCPRGRTSALVFKALCAQGQQTIASIEFWTGLSAMQVIGAIKRMLAQGVVESAGMVQAPGRPRCASYQIVGL